MYGSQVGQIYDISSIVSLDQQNRLMPVKFISSQGGPTVPTAISLSVDTIDFT